MISPAEFPQQVGRQSQTALLTLDSHLWNTHTQTSQGSIDPAR